jgi:hypothetical protein
MRHIIHNLCCGSGISKSDPGPEFFHPGSRIQVKKIPDPDPHQRIRFFNPKIVSKLSEK